MRRNLALLLIGILVLGTLPQTAWSSEDDLEQTKKEYFKALKELEDIEEQIQEADLRAQQHAKENLPPGVLEKLKKNWGPFMGYLLKGLTIIHILSDPTMGVKSLLTGYLLEQMKIDENEIKVLQDKKRELDKMKLEMAQLNVQIADFKLNIEREKNCLHQNEEAVSKFLKQTEEDSCEKAQRELQKSQQAGRLTAQAAAETEKALVLIQQAFAEALRAIQQLEADSRSPEVVDRKCTEARQAVSEVQSAAQSAYQRLMALSPFFNTSRDRWREACEAAARLADISRMTKGEIDALESKAKTAAGSSRMAAQECERNGGLVKTEAERARVMNQKAIKLIEEIEGLRSRASGGSDLANRVEGLVASAIAQAQQSKGKPGEASAYATEAETARDNVVGISRECNKPELVRSMLQAAQEAAVSSRKAAANAQKNISNAETMIKDIESLLGVLKANALKQKETKGCNVQSGDNFEKDAQASQDTSSIFVSEALNFATEAERCSQFVNRAAQTRICSTRERWDESKKSCVCIEGYERIGSQCLPRCGKHERRNADGECVYDPTLEEKDQGKENQPVDLARVNREGDKFQEEQPGGRRGDEQKGPQEGIPQPDSYTGGQKTPEETGGTTSPTYPVPPPSDPGRTPAGDARNFASGLTPLTPEAGTKGPGKTTPGGTKTIQPSAPPGGTTTSTTPATPQPSQPSLSTQPTSISSRDSSGKFTISFQFPKGEGKSIQSTKIKDGTYTYDVIQIILDERITYYEASVNISVSGAGMKGWRMYIRSNLWDRGPQARSRIENPSKLVLKGGYYYQIEIDYNETLKVTRKDGTKEDQVVERTSLTIFQLKKVK